jgi:glycosyltransferase involved in cell wall biosynthesis
MRILMIAPQPFFEPRGAPFCVYQHIKALVTLGYEVDLVTYPMGKRVDLPGLRIYRAPSLPFIRGVKPGPSLAKFPLDLLVFMTALWRLCQRRYKYIHTHEEAGAMGVLLASIFGCSHLYYMHSDLSQVVASSEFTKSRLVMRCVDAVQKFMVRKANAVIAFYPEIVSQAKRIAPNKQVYMILPPAVDEELPAASQAEVVELRQSLKLADGPVLLYTGTLESYQGIDLWLQSAITIRTEFPSARFVIAGGRPDQVEKLQLQAEKLGVAEIVRFVGQRPLEEMPRYMGLAEIVVSPRSKGTHTPLKLYTYLRSGKPILATDILAHTQILTSQVAHLVAATPEDLAQGTLELLRNPRRAQALGARAQQVAEQQYSWSAFLEKNRQVYSEFMGTPLRGEAA